MRKKSLAFFLSGIIAFAYFVNAGCSNSNSNLITGIFEYPDQLTNKGIGPIKDLQLDSISPALADQGKIIFQLKCAPCHRFDMRLNGPPLNGVTRRRTPEWIMNIILNPTEMLQNDPIAKDVFEKLTIPMVFQDVSKEQARAILEYLRLMDDKKEVK